MNDSTRKFGPDGISLAKAEQLRAAERIRNEAESRAMEGLATILSCVRQQRGAGATGQSMRLLRFVAGVYNGPRYPFDLTDLRGLDLRLSDACLDILAYDRFGWAEIHHWGLIDGNELNKLFEEAGLFAEAEARRMGRELYQQRYPDGHEEEGMSE